MASSRQTLQIVAFLDIFAFALIVSLVPNHARALGGNHILIGTMNALYALAELVSGPAVSTLSELLHRKSTLLLVLSASGLTYVFFGLTSSITIFMGLRVILGFFNHALLLTKGLVPEYEKEKNKISEFNGSLDNMSLVSMLIGPIIAGHVMDDFPYYGFTIISLLVGSMFAVNSGLIRKLPEKENKENSEEKEKPEEKENSKEKDIAKATEAEIAPKLMESIKNSFNQSLDQFYKIDFAAHWELLLYHILLTLATRTYFCTFAVFLKKEHQISTTHLGYVVSFLFTLGPLTNNLTKYASEYYGEDKATRNYHVFLVLMVSFIGMTLAPTISIFVFFIVPFTFAAALGRVVTLEAISKVDDKQKTTVVGVTNSIRLTLGVVAPMLSGIVGQFLGITCVLYICVLIAAGGVYLTNKTSSQVPLETKTKDE